LSNYFENLKNNRAVVRAVAGGTAVSGVGLTLAKLAETNSLDHPMSFVPALATTLASAGLFLMDIKISEKIHNLRERMVDAAVPMERKNIRSIFSRPNIERASMALTTFTGTLLGAYLLNQIPNISFPEPDYQITIPGVAQQPRETQEYHFFQNEP
jgi:hypothetical protein